MIALLKKDWRMNRAIVIGGVVLAAMPYIILLSIYAFEEDRHRHTGEINDLLIGAAAAAMWITAMVASSFGGAAFAQERHERSSDFLAMLPVPRRHIIFSKLFVSFTWLITMWSVNFVILKINEAFAVRSSLLEHGGLWQSVATSASCALMFFGVGWLLSTFLHSASRAALVSICATVALMITIMLLIDRQVLPNRSAEDLTGQVIFGWTLVIGLTSILWGSLYYVRRIEP